MEILDKFKLCGLIIGGCLLLRWAYQLCILGYILPDMCLLFGLVPLLLVLDIVRLRPGKCHQLHGVLLQYVVQKALSLVGFFVSRKLDSMSENIQVHQDILLRKILEQNSDTDVGKMIGIDKVESVKDFRTMIPLTAYHVYEKFVNKIEENGSENVFFPGKVDYIAWTSGTSAGRSKKFPKSISILRQTSAKWLLLAQRCFTNLPRNHFIRKWLAVRCAPNTWRSKSGIRCGPISGLASNYSLNFYVVPDIAKDFKDEETVIYVNLVFGLKYPDICNLFFSTAQMALSFFQILERKWEHICDDIESGTLSDIQNLSTNEVNILTQSLGGRDAKRAEFLRNEFEKGFIGIVPRVWPDCPGLFCLATGSFQTQADVVRERYLGSVPIFSPFHAGTESFYGINLHLGEPEVTYTFMVPFNYFEFIPVEHIEDENPETLLCNELRVGGVYELVVTTWEGLYRYRTEDIVEIVSFYGTIPRYKFVRRKNDVLSVKTEHVPETLVSQAVRTVAKMWNKQIVDFVTTENIYVDKVTGDLSEQRYYMVFLEIQHDDVLTQKESEMVDVHLQKLHEMYGMFRTSGSLQALKIFQVRCGTFQCMGSLIRAVNMATSFMQYKLPRIVRRKELVQYLLDNRLNITESSPLFISDDTPFTPRIATEKLV
ncbi:uncharacterized protein LOC123537398 [Mercenaria mercenaria]|uniref:uncharacterized protein LOC123537398 n=1 Tax=Mercenaria mercenaria TaxID=6596 RepID=UPI001E1DD3B4|nr:uncharacterized protein LOC123537398 [Mercenaria mercenaria]XP_053384538.1 uncharacterized protein LOC123537398 [Mercenaria mercenaria]